MSNKRSIGTNLVILKQRLKVWCKNIRWCKRCIYFKETCEIDTTCTDCICNNCKRGVCVDDWYSVLKKRR